MSFKCRFGPGHTLYQYFQIHYNILYESVSNTFLFLTQLWNLTTGELFNSFVFDGSAKAVTADHAELQLFVGLKDGSIRMVNAAKSVRTKYTLHCNLIITRSFIARVWL